MIYLFIYKNEKNIIYKNLTKNWIILKILDFKIFYKKI